MHIGTPWLVGGVQPEVAGSPSERLAREAPEAAPDLGDKVPERPSVRLADLGGMEAVKARLEAAFLAPLRNLKLVRYGRLNWGIALIALVFVVSAASARAATTEFIGQVSPNTLTQSPTVALAGDQVAAFDVQVRPARCAGISDPGSIDDDDVSGWSSRPVRTYSCRADTSHTAALHGRNTGPPLRIRWTAVSSPSSAPSTRRTPW